MDHYTIPLHEGDDFSIIAGSTKMDNFSNNNRGWY